MLDKYLDEDSYDESRERCEICDREIPRYEVAYICRDPLFFNKTVCEECLSDLIEAEFGRYMLRDQAMMVGIDYEVKR